MFTETEVREALEHSAARATAITESATGRRGTPRRVPRLLPALAAAAVVGVVATVAVAVGGSSTTHHPASGSDAAGGTASADAHVPARIAVADLVHIGAASAGGIPWRYDLGSPLINKDNFELVIPEMNYPNGSPRTTQPAGSVELVVLPESLHFDPATRFFDPQQLDVDGNPGYFGDVVLRPITGGPRSGADRALGVEQPDGTWVFVEALVKDPSSVSAADLVAEFRRLQVTTGARSSVRVPVTTGFLPSGMSLVEVGTTEGSPNSGMTFQDGSKQLEIILPEPIVGFPGSIGRATATASKVVGGRTVQVRSVGYDQATVQRVLDTLQIHDLTDPTTWPDIQQAFG